jgi:DNA primase
MNSNIEDLLLRLNIDIVREHNDEYLCHCPAHLARTGKEDRNPSWWINADTGMHICFSCGFKGGLGTLIEQVQGINYEEAKTWINESYNDLNERLTKALKVEKEVETQSQPITESMLSAFVDPPQEVLLDRGISLAAAQYYEIKWSEQSKSWITVIRDPITKSLLGWQEKGHGTRYFKNWPTGVQKSKSLFGYKQFVEQGLDRMIVVESPLDVARLLSVGVFGGASTYGAIVSSYQINLIRFAKEVLFALDNDEAGRKSSLELLNACKSMGIDGKFFNYSHTDMKDIGAMSKDEILIGIDSAKHYVRGVKAII